MNILTNTESHGSCSYSIYVFFSTSARGMISSVLDQAQKMFQKSNMTIKKNIIYMQQRRLLTETESFGKKEKIAIKSGLVAWYVTNFYYYS